MINQNEDSTITVELLRSLIDKEDKHLDPDYRGWVTVAQLKDSLSSFSEQLPICISGYSAYSFKNIFLSEDTSESPIFLNIEVEVIPGCKHHGQGTQTQIAYADADHKQGFIGPPKKPFSLKMSFIEPTFTDRNEGDLHEYKCGLTAGKLISILEHYEDRICVRVLCSENYEIIRLRQLSQFEQTPAVLEIEIADFPMERQTQIFDFQE